MNERRIKAEATLRGNGNHSLMVWKRENDSGWMVMFHCPAGGLSFSVDAAKVREFAEGLVTKCGGE